MSPEEARAYSRGYQAGKRRKQRDINDEKRIREEKHFRDRAFLAALPACIQAQGWTRGDKTITKLEDRVRLAWDAAEEAAKQRRVRN